ncbi:hypothetical protein KC19_10G116800 [Ceratodon purpureus]|uniref:TIR domain-containing protein n=1 Tax=Ceratodon purpureus TaxID=3225 RepID=A0A8T0GKQ4_CERPU|nr:hypothetical protein KC19_10G116800 [Ceratodon purpureus]
MLEAKHKVFLSHSGAQKDFVEQLCVDLERCDRHLFFDKRRSSLPIGEKFPSLIFDAIRQCHVGILVLSKEFFTKTKWPMLELVAMVRELKSPNSRLKLIPVFYKLSREEWLDHENRSKWIAQWKEWASVDKSICIEEWKKALDALKSINSLMMRDGEVHLHREIVDAVCKIVLPETRWDDSHVQGRSRLCEILLQKINEREKRNGIQVMGLYGIGGIGKTTMCKAMCNEVFERYEGRVCHVELNTTSEVEILRSVLRRLSTIELEHVGGLNIDECRDKLRRCIVKQPVFLAIDNLLDNPEAKKQARTLLGTRWAEGSVVIVTTRAQGELINLNQYIQREDCIGMPELMEEEATSLFLNHVTCGQCATIATLDKGLISRCVERCHFGKGEGLGRHYIPLALEVLGEQLGCNGYDAELWEEQLKNIDVFKEKLTKDEHPIFSILRTSYDSLSEDVQMLFMDTALFLPSHPFLPFDMYKWNLFDWLSTVHGTSVGEVMKQLEYLKRRSLLESLGDGRTRMVMHDLWREFCVAEAAIGKFEDGRCLFVEEESSKLAETSPGPGGCWRNMRRMCFLNEGWRCLDGVQVDLFVNLLLLKVESGSFSLGGSLEVDVKGLRHLKSLELKTRHLNVKCAGLGSLSKLAYLRWENYHTPPPDVEEIGSLRKLQVLILEGFKGDKLPDLGMLTSLRLVSFQGCAAVKTISGLGSKLTNIEFLSLRECYSLQECPGVGDLYALEELNLGHCGQLKDVPCLRMLTRLRRLIIEGCQQLRAVPGLSDLVALEELWASGCTGLEVLPDLRKLSKLRKLKCAGCSALKRLTCTTPLRAVEQIDLRDCSSLEEMPDLSTFSQLKWLRLGGCTGLRTLTSSAPLRALLELDLEGCSKLSALPDHLSGSVDLEQLRLQKSGIVLHEDEITELKACCRRLEVFPSSARSVYGGLESSCLSAYGSSNREMEVDDFEVINAQNGCRSRRLPDTLPREKIARLVYTRAGGALLALTSTGILKLWNWGRIFDDPGWQATVSIAPQLWLHASGRLMVNNMNDVNRKEVVHSLALSKDGYSAISASGGEVYRYDIRTSETLYTIMCPPPTPTSIAFYPHDNNIVAIGMADSTIQILNTIEQVVVCTLAGHHDKVIGLAFSIPDNSTSVLVSLSADAQLCVWKTEEWGKRQSRFGLLQPDQRTVCAGDLRVQFHNDQRHVLVVGKSQLAVYDTLNVDRPITEWVPQSPFTAAITDATYSCTGHRVFVGFADGSVAYLDSKFRPRRRLVPPIHPPLGASGSTAYPVAIAAHPKIRCQFALGMSDGSVIVVELRRAPADKEPGSGEGSHKRKANCLEVCESFVDSFSFVKC